MYVQSKSYRIQLTVLNYLLIIYIIFLTQSLFIYS